MKFEMDFFFDIISYGKKLFFCLIIGLKGKLFGLSYDVGLSY